MTIWLLAAALILLFGALGYAKGAIRMVFPLLGLILGVFLSVPLGPLVKPIVPMVGLQNPIWSWLLPPVIVFFLITLVFVIIGFVVHRQANLYYKYRTDDHRRLTWERLNKRLGVCIGVVAGACYTVIIGLVVYIMGYLTVQVSAGDNDAAIVRYLNTAHADLRSSGLERLVAKADPTPENYYLASDILGLLYYNKLLHDRLAAYPAFLSLGERQEFQDLATDAEFQNLLATQATVGQVLNHPKTQAILNNQEIIQQLGQTDLRDLLQYLKTGQSPKYSDIKLLGRWQLDPYTTLLQMKKRKSRISTAEMRMLRQQLDFLKAYSLMATPDNNVKLKGPDVLPIIQKYSSELAKAFAEGAGKKTTVQVVPATPPPTQAPTTSASTLDRYRNRPGVPRPAPQAATTTTTLVAAPTTTITPAAVAAEVAKLPIVVLAQGTWKGDDPKYDLTLQSQAPGFKFDSGSKSATVEAEIKDDRLYLTDGHDTLVMARF
ncbi:MAG TPA: CvpA family protein [Candidatus Nitrosotalea sp.]|nr:CvpA family protein [Candidatus Nitrosotalea sp.]